MFSLIITIIAVALVALLAVASIYYGGDVFTSGSDRSEAARFVNEAQQISSAISLYKADNNGAAPANILVLKPDYLKEIPGPEGEGGWQFGDGYVQISGLSLSQCNAANAQMNKSYVGPPPACGTNTDPSIVCCDNS